MSYNNQPAIATITDDTTTELDFSATLTLERFGLWAQLELLGDFGGGTATVAYKAGGTTQQYLTIGSSGDITAQGEGETIFVPCKEIVVTLTDATDPNLTILLIPHNN